MSQHKPHSLLSFIYNTTIDPPYRLEMHMDMQVAFDRFNVTAQPAQLDCYNVEQAAYRLRKSSDDIEASGTIDPKLANLGRKQMATSTDSLFDKLAEELISRIEDDSLTAPISLARSIDPTADANGPADADWSVLAVESQGRIKLKTGGGLLQYLYSFFHFREARKAMIEQLHIVAAVPGLSDPQAVVKALRDLDTHMDLPISRRDNQTIRLAVEALCRELGSEYNRIGWHWCW